MIIESEDKRAHSSPQMVGVADQRKEEAGERVDIGHPHVDGSRNTLTLDYSATLRTSTSFDLTYDLIFAFIVDISLRSVNMLITSIDLIIQCLIMESQAKCILGVIHLGLTRFRSSWARLVDHWRSKRKRRGDLVMHMYEMTVGNRTSLL